MFYNDIHFTYPAFGEIYKMRDIFATGKCDIILQAKLRYDINPFSLAFAYAKAYRRIQRFYIALFKVYRKSPRDLYRCQVFFGTLRNPAFFEIIF